uniref:Uncharacterized protein n=1 Tax=Oryza meridionalis TaxID=40149 RepID=A0A0E0DIH2_9ORYZ
MVTTGANVVPNEQSAAAYERSVLMVAAPSRRYTRSRRSERRYSVANHRTRNRRNALNNNLRPPARRASHGHTGTGAQWQLMEGGRGDGMGTEGGSDGGGGGTAAAHGERKRRGSAAALQRAAVAAAAAAALGGHHRRRLLVQHPSVASTISLLLSCSLLGDKNVRCV